MRVTPTPTLRYVLALLVSLSGFVCLGAQQTRAAGETRPTTAIQFTLDRPIDAGAAPFIVAGSDGLYSQEGLTVTTEVANGSREAIARVASDT